MVVAQVAQVDGVEDVGRAAVATVLRVGRVGHAGQRQRVVLDTEVERPRPLPAKVGDERIVCVEHRLRAAACQRVAPAVGDRLELSVAVELVTEQIPQKNRPWMELLRQLRQPQLIHLEEAKLTGHAPTRAGCVEQRRGHATRHIGARPVMHQRDAVPGHYLRQHGGRRGLAIGGGDQGAALA